MRKSRETSLVFSLLSLLGCGTNGADADGGIQSDTSPTPDGATPPPPTAQGDAGLSGPQAFPVSWQWISPTESGSQCGANVLPDGGLASVSVVLSGFDFSAIACGDAAITPAGHERFVDIELATQEYAANSRRLPLTQSLAVGTYVIGNEHVPDEDLCMLPPGATAILQVRELPDAGGGGANAVWNAVSGTVTVTSVSAHAIAGMFETVLGDANGGSASGGMLSGSFNASGCP